MEGNSFKYSCSPFQCLIKTKGNNGNIINITQTFDASRNLTPKRALEIILSALQDKNVKSIEVSKVVDFIEGDIF